MEEFSALFSFENDAFRFHRSLPTEYLEQQAIRQDLPIPDASVLITPVFERNNEIINVERKGKRQRKSTAVQEDAGNGSDTDNQLKRFVHRDIERRRRQEMANLFGSLRALVPLQFVQAKRSMSVQLNEAVNYIKYQEKHIRQLQEKRNKLRNWLAASNPDGKEGTSRNSFLVEIRVRQCFHGGIEILISNGVGKEQCPLSSVLKVLAEEGLTVASCSTTKVNDKFLHTIDIEARSHFMDHDIRIRLQKTLHSIKASANFH